MRAPSSSFPGVVDAGTEQTNGGSSRSTRNTAAFPRTARAEPTCASPASRLHLSAISWSRSSANEITHAPAWWVLRAWTREDTSTPGVEEGITAGVEMVAAELERSAADNHCRGRDLVSGDFLRIIRGGVRALLRASAMRPGWCRSASAGDETHPIRRGAERIPGAIVLPFRCVALVTLIDRESLAFE